MEPEQHFIPQYFNKEIIAQLNSQQQALSTPIS